LNHRRSQALAASRRPDVLRDDFVFGLIVKSHLVALLTLSG
jgi:hypothetical protein